jgi:ArsR family transcriptional regulator
MSDKYSVGSQVFKALSNPKRAVIVDMLSAGEMCASKILEKFDLSQSTLSHHMKSLCESGLVKAREDGKWTHYTLNSETVAKTRTIFNEITSASA